MAVATAEAGSFFFRQPSRNTAGDITVPGSMANFPLRRSHTFQSRTPRPMPSCPPLSRRWQAALRRVVSWGHCRGSVHPRGKM